ncbi:hypothetical protein [Streptomyces sp. DH41]|uniref:hypothetical protein n=1 Tax=Streptomyces sp. DH41 TaxID=3040125 RepID=UPI002442A480|nr:hypothetical protein [Streptomyces sp. DH41]MDG9724264.1 hypothetical protein [Streptomyces sp. DH41]
MRATFQPSPSFPLVIVDLDVARDGVGCWRHPVRLPRPRLDPALDEAPLFDT